MPESKTQSVDTIKLVPLLLNSWKKASGPRASKLTKRNPLSGREWGAKLSAALFKEDERELERLLQSVSWVANELKPNISQTRTLSQMLIRAVRFAVRQTVLQAELCSLALTDELTGLFNRRGFLELAVHQLKMARRTSQGALLFYCDMDGLKQINDVCGHDEGDLALLRAAAALKSSFRDSDILARIGGDEFAVLAMEGAGLNCDVMFDRLEGTLRQSGEIASRYELSMSVGVARFDPRRPISMRELMRLADQDMYKQKSKRKKFCLVPGA